MICPDCKTEFKGGQFFIAGARGAFRNCPNGHRFKEPMKPRRTCKWTEDDEGNWDLECGEKFEVSSGLPSENGFLFCLYCGKHIEEVIYIKDAQP